MLAVASALLSCHPHESHRTSRRDAARPSPVPTAPEAGSRPPPPIEVSSPTTALTSLPVVDQETVRVAATPDSVAVIWLGHRLESWPRRRLGERIATRVAWWPSVPPSYEPNRWAHVSVTFSALGGQVLGVRANGFALDAVGVQAHVLGEDDVRQDCVAGHAPGERALCPQYLHDLVVTAAGPRAVFAHVAQHRGHPSDRPTGPFCVGTLLFPRARRSPPLTEERVGCVASSEDPRRWPHHLAAAFDERGGAIAWRSGDDGYFVRLDAAGRVAAAPTRVPSRGVVTDLALGNSGDRVNVGWCERDAASGERRRVVLRGDGTPARVGTCSLLAMVNSASRRWTAWVEPGDTGADVLRVGGDWQSSIDAASTIVARGAAIRSVAMTAVGEGAVLAWLDREAAAARWVRVRR